LRREKMAIMEDMEAAVKSNQEEVNATVLEANPKEKEAVAEHPEVPNEQAALETIGALGTGIQT
jgi:hypothetical protein